MCGENLYARHSISYNNLPSYFMAFSVWNELNQCLSWQDTKQFL
ncbi:MAG: RNA ligase family protein, partial [Pseudomonadota bacterium]